MTVDVEVLDWIREAAATADSWDSVGTGLRARDPDGEDPRLRPFILAFGYTLHERFSSTRERAGEPFGAMIAGEGWRFPPALSDIDEDDVDAWREAVTAVDDPIVQARLGDLLWERKARPDPHLAAGAACDGLLRVAENPAWHGMYRVRCLSRALELARETRDDARQSAVVERMIAFADQDLGSTGGGPGLPLGVLRPLVALPTQERPEGLDDLLQRVVEKYRADPYIIDSVADLRSRLLDDPGRQELRQEQVKRWREEAAKGDGMLRVHRLEQALEIARSYGLNDEANELRRELGAIGPEELGLTRISAEVEMPREEVERFLQSFEDASGWQEAMRTLAAQGPPGGAPQELADQVDQLMEEHPMQFLFTKALVGPDNATPIFRAATREDHHRLAVAEQRAQQARVWGMFCAQALQRIGRRDDRPTRAALTEFLTGDFIDAEVAERIARAIELYWEEQFDESAHVLVPRLERVLREMARQVGIPVVREPRPGREVGGVEMLGGLLRDLEGAFADASWHAYLLNLLADPLGLNLRNNISHGLHGTVGPVDASLLIQAALLLAGMSLERVENPPEPPAGAGPWAPTGSTIP
jgi:hypothetical protein